jgi:hypothetical protein
MSLGCGACDNPGGCLQPGGRCPHDPTPRTAAAPPLTPRERAALRGKSMGNPRTVHVCPTQPTCACLGRVPGRSITCEGCNCIRGSGDRCRLCGAPMHEVRIDGPDPALGPAVSPELLAKLVAHKAAWQAEQSFCRADHPKPDPNKTTVSKFEAWREQFEAEERKLVRANEEARRAYERALQDWLRS